MTMPSSPRRKARAATTMPAADARLLEVSIDAGVAHVRLNRPAKRNALSDGLIAALHDTFSSMPPAVHVVVLSGEGDHFCAGLDLSELQDRSATEGLVHSRQWHAAFEEIQFGRVPVVAVLQGAVVGGGLELASSAHIRVAESSAFFALPEGTRGLFVGGGGSARISRLIGVSRMTDMMLTGRVFDAAQAQQTGLVNYLAEPGTGLAMAMDLARRIAANAPLSNFAIIHALPRIADQSQGDGLFTESLMASITQSDPAAKSRMRAFLAGKARKVTRS